MDIDPVVGFRRAAEGYRAVIEAVPGESVTDYAQRVRRAVAEVYCAATRLGQPRFVDGPDPPDLGRRASTALLEASLRDCFGNDDRFLDVWDPTNPEKGDPIWRTLSSELVEIYEDLGVALAQLASADDPDAAVWDIVEAFRHWGKHAVDVARPLHHLAW